MPFYVGGKVPGRTVGREYSTYVTGQKTGVFAASGIQHTGGKWHKTRCGIRKRIAPENLCHKAFNPPLAKEQIGYALAKLRSIGGRIDHGLGDIDRFNRSFDQQVAVLVRHGATAELTRQVAAERAAGGFSRTAITWRRCASTIARSPAGGYMSI